MTAHAAASRNVRRELARPSLDHHLRHAHASSVAARYGDATEDSVERNINSILAIPNNNKYLYF